MEESPVNIWFIDCYWRGPRHTRLRRIWDAYLLYSKEKFRQQIFLNPHFTWAAAESCRMAWLKEKRLPNRYAIFTEFDFLPDFENFMCPEDFDERGLLASESVFGVGGPNAKGLGHAVTWYVFVDKQRCKHIDFTIGGLNNDPGANMDAKLYLAEPGYPEYYGARIKTGTHLYWQRHLEDPKDMIVGEERMRLGDMQEKHDRFVNKWLRLSPHEFKEIYDATKARLDSKGAQARAP
jgi:hypothetical protein